MATPTFQAQVQTFSEVQAQPNYQKLPSEIQAQIALDYFDTRVATQQGYQAAPPEAQQAMRQDFLVKYKVPEVQAAHGAFKPQAAAPQPVQAPAVMPKPQDILATSVLKHVYPHARGLQGLTLGYLDQPAKAIENQLKQQNQFGLAEQITGGAQEFAGGVVPALLGDKGISKLPLLAKLPQMAQLGLSGAAVGGAYNQPNDERLQSAAIGGGLGAIGSKLPQLIGGVSRFFKGKPQPVYQGKPVTRKLPKPIQGEYGVNTRMFRGTNQERIANRAAAENKFIESLAKEVSDLRLQGKVNESRLFLGNATRNLSNAADVRAKVNDRLLAGKPKKLELTSKEEFQSIVDSVYQMRKTGDNKAADIELGKYTPEAKAKVYDRVKRQEKIDKLRDAQAIADSKALANAEKENAKRATNQLKGGIKERATEQKELNKQYEAEFKKLLAEEKASMKKQSELANQGRKTQDLRERQSIKDSIALERAESKNRRRELSKLKASMKETANEQKRQIQQQKGEQPAQGKEKTASTQAPTVKTGTQKQSEIELPGRVSMKQFTKDKAVKVKEVDAEPIIAKQFYGVKEGQAVAEGLKTPSQVRTDSAARLTPKGKATLAKVEQAFNADKKVKLEYIKDPTRKASATIQADNGERSISGLKISKTGNVTIMAHTDEGVIRSYSLDSIDKITVLDKPSVPGPYAKAGSYLPADIETVVAKINKGEAVNADEITAAVKGMPEKDFADTTKGLDDAKIEQICKEVNP